MAKTELGTKRVCPETGRKFYDLGKTPVISPYTGKVVPIVVPRAVALAARTRGAGRAAPAPVAEAETIVPETADAEFVSLEDAEAEQQGKKPAAAEGAAEGERRSRGRRDASTMPPSSKKQDEGDPDVTDIIGEAIEKEEET